MNFAEEELKRLKTRGYGQIGFNYDQERTSTNSPDESKRDDEDSKDEPPDEIYVPNSKFFIPPGMVLVSIVDGQISINILRNVSISF